MIRPIFCSLFAISTAYAEIEPCVPLPWLTGALVSPAGTIVSVGHAKFKNYLYVTIDTGRYDDHWHAHSTPNFYRISPRLNWRFGLTEWMDIQIIPHFFYNITEGESSVHFGDFPVGLEFQLVSATAHEWLPGIKFSAREYFPTGKYQKLNPQKKRTDSTGNGSFATQPGLVLYKLYHLHDLHFLSAKLSLDYTLYTPIHVRGFNTYGGDAHTRGKVIHGNFFQGTLSFEYTLNKHWVFAIDGAYYHRDKNRFSGTTTAAVGNPSSEQVSFAPALEYNFSDRFGIIAGSWFTAWGRNSARFASGVINFEYKY